MKIALLLVITLCFTLTASKKTCKALAFQDGGDQTAFEAGAFYYMANNLNKKDLEYDVVTGISFGAVNAAYLAQFQKGKEKDAADGLKDMWMNTDHQEIYSAYNGGLIHGFLFEESIYSTTPLKSWLAKYLSKDKVRKLDFGATDSNTNEFVRYNETLNTSQLVEALMASTSIPVIYPYQEDNGRYLMSGNLMHSLDSRDAVLRCLEIAKEEKDITIDVILTATELSPDLDLKEKTFNAFLRYEAMLTYSRALRDYTEATEYYPDVNWRYVILPSEALPSHNFPFAFKQSDIDDLFTLGEKAAEEAINNMQQSNNPSQQKEDLVNKYYTQVLEKHLIEPTPENIEKYRSKINSRMQQFKDGTFEFE